LLLQLENSRFGIPKMTINIDEFGYNRWLAANKNIQNGK